MENKCYVYKITNTLTDDCYVGVSTKPYRRLAQHQKAKSKVGDAIRCFGIENFILSILLVGDEQYCYGYEPRLIAEHQARYNVVHNTRADGEFKYDEAVIISTDGKVAHPGGLVRSIIVGNGSNISDTARAIDMDRASLSMVTSGKVSVTRDLAFKIGARFNDAAADLIIAAIRAYEDQESVHQRAKYAALIERRTA